MRKQEFRHGDEVLLIAREDVLAALVGRVDDGLDLLIDLCGDLLGIRLGLRHRAADENFIVAGFERDRAEPVAHAVHRDHLARDLRGALDVVRRAGRNVAEHQLFGNAAAKQRDDLLFHIALGLVRAVLRGQRDRHAARAAARNDRDLVHGIVRRQCVHHDGVTGLVIGGQLALVLADDAALLLGTCDDLDLRLREVGHRDELAAAARGEQRRLVREVLEVCACEAGRALCDGGEVHILGKGLVFDMDLQDLLAAADVGKPHVDLTVEAARAQQRGVENVGAVRRRHDDDALIRTEAVHFDEQLVERLLALVVAAAEARAALTAHGVDLVDEDDRGGNFLRLFEEVTHAARADADIHLDKIRAGDRQKLHARLARDGAGQQRFTRARRADEQHALGDARAEVDELARRFQKVDDLLQFLFFLIRTGDVRERRGALVVSAGLERRRAEFCHAVAAASARGADGEEVPDGEDAEHR